MSYRRAGLASMGSLLVPEDQAKRLDGMRRETLERIDSTARGLSHAVIAGGLLSALSTAVLVRNAYKMRGGR